MIARRFAQIAGAVYLLVGILGFLPFLLLGDRTPPPDLAVDAGYGLLLGLFPINVLHNLVHLLIGAWGLVASRSYSGAKGFARGLAVLYILLALLAFITPTMFGLVPIHSHDIWLHALTGLVAGYIGFAMNERAEARV